MELTRKLESCLFNYTYLEPVALGESYSTNIKLRRNFDNTLWVGKLHRDLRIEIKDYYGSGKHYTRTVNFTDVNERALLGFRLARVAGLKSLKTKIIPLKRVEGFNAGSVAHERVGDVVFLSEFRGQSLTHYLESNSFSTFAASDVKDKDEAIRSFVFNLWIGNYDNKDRDYLVDENKSLTSIDYHLLGTGFRDDPKLALGAWCESFDMDSPDDTGWCVGNGKLLDFVSNNKNRWEPFQQTIGKINSISVLQIRWAMRGLTFYNQGTNQKINTQFLDFLLARRPKLEQTIRAWFAAGCPVVRLPKNNGIV